jgi:hypothetical protein
LEYQLMLAHEMQICCLITAWRVYNHSPGKWLYQVGGHGTGPPTIFKADSRRRLYTQLDISRAGEVAKSRQANSADAAESSGQLDISTITAEEVAQIRGTPELVRGLEE